VYAIKDEQHANKMSHKSTPQQDKDNSQVNTYGSHESLRVLRRVTARRRATRRAKVGRRRRQQLHVRL
jgi:hypothetical protein